MALGEVVDKGFDIMRDILIAPSAVAFLHPALVFLPVWAMHILTALVFSAIVVTVREMRKNKHVHVPHLHHRPVEVRRVPPRKLRSATPA